MNDRERFLKWMNYEPVDRLPIHTVGAWPDTLARWRQEGLPADTSPNDFLGITPLRVRNISPNTGPFPPFATKIIKEEGNIRHSIDGYGRTVRDFTDHTSMPEWIDFAVKTPDDLRRVLDEHYQVDDLDARFADSWEVEVRAAGESGELILIDGGCYYWTLRSFAGVANAGYLFYDAPDLVDELFERYCTVCLEGIRRAVKLTTIDLIGFGEDIAYKNGPLVSPPMFRKLILPRVKRVMDLAHEHGVRLTWYDSDGDTRQLIPDYLSVGVNSTAPCEVAAKMVPTELRREFGRDLRIIGGIDKRAVAAGRDAIDAEFERNRELLAEGGFLPAIDHSVSADISFNNYRYFIDVLREYSKRH